MHTRTMERWQHAHDYALRNEKGERTTLYVLILTAVTMVVEIIAGSIYGSMALLADGWHMGTHVAAFLVAIFAYRYARIHANDPKYAFGTGKVTVLGGFASAVALAVVALPMAVESLYRLLSPQEISFDESIVVAAVGLVVNLASMLLFKDAHHEHHDHDHNLKAAYMHVLADAMTSFFAIFALLLGKYYGLNWLDPVMGIVGAVIITKWAIGLLKESVPMLLDETIDVNYQTAIKEAIERDSDNRVSDLHIWRVGAKDCAAIISIVTHFPKPNEHYRKLLKPFGRLSHVNIELHVCEDEPCIKKAA